MMNEKNLVLIVVSSKYDKSSFQRSSFKVQTLNPSFFVSLIVFHISNFSLIHFTNPREMATSTGSSMLLSSLLFIVVLSLEVIYRGKLASSELYTILGGFINSLLFLFAFVFIGNFQESSGTKTGWGAAIFAELIALVAASTVHRVCVTTCFLFSAGLLYEVNKLSGMVQARSELKSKSSKRQ